MGPSLPEDNCTRAPGFQLHQEAGRFCFPFPATPALPREKPSLSLRGKQSWQQEAEGHSAVEK